MLVFLPLLKFKKPNEDLGVREEKRLVWMTGTVKDRAGTGLQMSQLIPDGHLALGEQSRKVRLAQGAVGGGRGYQQLAV